MSGFEEVGDDESDEGCAGIEDEAVELATSSAAAALEPSSPVGLEQAATSRANAASIRKRRFIAVTLQRIPTNPCDQPNDTAA